MRDVAITEFKKLQVKDIKEGASFRLTADGEFIGFFVVPISGDRKVQIEGMCEQMNAAIGKKE